MPPEKCDEQIDGAHRWRVCSLYAQQPSADGIDAHEFDAVHAT